MWRISFPAFATHPFQLLPYELLIALRHLRAKRKQVMISVITGIAIAAVAAGVASLITVLAMMTGFREEFQTKILSGTAHLNLMRKDGRPIENYRELEERLLKLPQIRAASATLYHRVLIQGKRDIEGALLKGVDLSAPKPANEVFQFTIKGDPQMLAEPETDAETGVKIDRIIIGRDLAQAIGADIGDVVTVLSPKGHLTPIGLAPLYRDFKVVGLFESGLAEYDSTWAYISLEAAQRLSGQEKVAEIIQMKVDDIYAVKEIGRRCIELAGEAFTVRDWQELNAPIYTALSYEKLLSSIALLIVIAIAALNVITVLIIMVIDKQRDIAILKSMGATDRSVMWVFIVEGLLIGAAGVIIGVAAGAAFCYFADSKQLIKLPPGAYALSYIPFHVHLSDVGLVAAATMLISLLSTIYPSRTAARLQPAEALRYE
jgi:lipoprotein-releasing system permease protein